MLLSPEEVGEGTVRSSLSSSELIHDQERSRGQVVLSGVDDGDETGGGGVNLARVAAAPAATEHHPEQE